MRYAVSDTDVNADRFADSYINVDTDCDTNGFTDPARNI